MSGYRSAEQYLADLEKRSAPPEGFQIGLSTLRFVPREKPGEQSMNLCLLLLEEDSPLFAGVLTRNRFCGAPVLICRNRLENPRLRGVLVNNRVANVGAPGGEEAARGLLERLGEHLGVSEQLFLPASTGVVGWGLPRAEMEGALPALVQSLQGRSVLPAARGIMTTDSYPKVHREEVGRGCIVGICKGAGMIEPNMATLLVFLMTDLAMSRQELRESLAFCVQRSFNRISVDGDQSTSDMALLLSSGRRPAVQPGEFRRGLLAVCGRLAEEVVRNGEGVGHVVRVRVEGAGSGELAAAVGKAVVNSPLVKTAVFGNDPNVGRIVAAVGDYLGNAGLSQADPARFRFTLGGTVIFEHGRFTLDPRREEKLAGYLRECALDPALKGFPVHDRCVEIVIDLGLAPGGADQAVEVVGADLSYEYVRENADYRS